MEDPQEPSQFTNGVEKNRLGASLVKTVFKYAILLFRADQF
jgi:hypothetical protein